MEISSSYSNNYSSYYKNDFTHLEKEDDTLQKNSSQATNIKTEEEKSDKNEKEKKTTNELTPEQEAQVEKLQKRDEQVRAHEAAHIAAGGGVVTGGASFTYQTGPDGRSYAIGGEVPIDASTESSPEATIAKMQKVRTAALAPVDPSPQDYKVAATATLLEMQARVELMQEKSKEQEEKNSSKYGETQEKEEKNSLDLSA